MKDRLIYVLDNVCGKKREKGVEVVIETRHPSIQVVYGGIADVHGHDNMDEMLCVWIEKHMGGFEGALHLDEPIKLCPPQ